MTPFYPEAYVLFTGGVYYATFFTLENAENFLKTNQKLKNPKIIKYVRED